MEKAKKVYHLKVPPATTADKSESHTPIKLVYKTMLGRSYSTAFRELIEKHYFHN